VSDNKGAYAAYAATGIGHVMHTSATTGVLKVEIAIQEEAEVKLSFNFKGWRGKNPSDQHALTTS
jgi:hypothetical protein